MPSTRSNIRGNRGPIPLNPVPPKDMADSVKRLSDHFQSEMEKFREELTAVRQTDEVAEPTDVTTVDCLLQKFNTFQHSMDSQLRALRKEVESLNGLIAETTRSIDRNLQQSYRSKLLVYGLPDSDENDSEALLKKVVNCLNSHLKNRGIEITERDIGDCYRLGKKRGDKPRVIFVDFTRAYTRNLVFSNKSAFKGSSILVAEYLTRTRFSIFVEAKRRYNKDCWTLNGNVFVKKNGAKCIISDLKDLN